jgi:hypothetical protein
MGRAIYCEGRWVTAEALYAMEVSPETLIKYLRPQPEPASGVALTLFGPDVGRYQRPAAAELYERSRRSQRE